MKEAHGHTNVQEKKILYTYVSNFDQAQQYCVCLIQRRLAFMSLAEHYVQEDHFVHHF